MRSGHDNPCKAHSYESGKDRARTRPPVWPASAGSLVLATSPRSASHPRRGVIELDILAGLVIVGALTVALAAVLGRQHRAVQKLADSRAAMQLAEMALTDLQAGKPAAPANVEPDTAVEVSPLEVGPLDGASPAGVAPGVWVEVTARVRAGRASLVGLVPRDAGRTTGGGP